MPSKSSVSALPSPRGALLRILILCAVLGAALTADLALEPSDIPVRLSDVGRVLLSHTPLLHDWVAPPVSPIAEPIVWELRAPRAMMAALVGCLLAIAGVAFQGLLMNPLADPYTVGVSAGAAVGAALAELLGWSGHWLGFGQTASAFFFAMAAIVLVYNLARIGGRVSAQTFLLAGVVVGTFLWSLIPLTMVLARRADALNRIIYYLIGSLQGATWSRVILLLPFVAIGLILMQMLARELNLMTLGEESAAHLGVEIERFKIKVLVIGSLMTAAAVSVSGIIGFVGLVVPHIARRLVGPDHRRVLGVAAILGATLVVISDTAARVALGEMPVGVITSLIGAPFFCLLLRREMAKPS